MRVSSVALSALAAIAVQNTLDQPFNRPLFASDSPPDSDQSKSQRSIKLEPVQATAEPETLNVGTAERITAKHSNSSLVDRPAEMAPAECDIPACQIAATPPSSLEPLAALLQLPPNSPTASQPEVEVAANMSLDQPAFLDSAASSLTETETAATASELSNLLELAEGFNLPEPGVMAATRPAIDARWGSAASQSELQQSELQQPEPQQSSSQPQQHTIPLGNSHESSSAVHSRGSNWQDSSVANSSDTDKPTADSEPDALKKAIEAELAQIDAQSHKPLTEQADRLEPREFSAALQSIQQQEDRFIAVALAEKPEPRAAVPTRDRVAVPGSEALASSPVAQPETQPIQAAKIADDQELTGVAQSQPQAKPQSDSISAQAEMLKAGDQVWVEVVGAPEYSSQREIFVNGVLNAPPIERVPVAGRSLSQAATTLTHDDAASIPSAQVRLSRQSLSRQPQSSSVTSPKPLAVPTLPFAHSKQVSEPEQEPLSLSPITAGPLRRMPSATNL